MTIQVDVHTMYFMFQVISSIDCCDTGEKASDCLLY